MSWDLIKSYIAFILFILACPVFAQYTTLPLTIIDVSDQKLTDEIGRSWTPENGVWMPSTVNLPGCTNLEVFVAPEVLADSVVYWSNSNTSGDRRRLSAFVNEYHQRGWMISPKGRIYNLSDVNSVAEDIYIAHQRDIDRWNEATEDPRGKYAMALVLHPADGGAYQRVLLNEAITMYDDKEPLCPIYYANVTHLSNVDKVQKQQRYKRAHGVVKSDGLTATFTEQFDTIVPTNKRLVINRYITPCTFKNDVVSATSFYTGQPLQQQKARELLTVNAGNVQDRYQLAPLVFAGDNFQLHLLRRTGGDLLRDTLEHYRRQSHSQMESLKHWVEFRRVTSDTIVYDVPGPLWRLLLRYRSFDNLRNRLMACNSSLPATATESQAANTNNDERFSKDFYRVTSSMSLYRDFQAYVDSGHAMANRHVITSQKDLKDGYIAQTNQLQIYPEPQTVHRETVEHVNDSIYSYRWKLPNPSLFYQLVHEKYIHDFSHIDTLVDTQCDCERAIPMRFLTIKTGVADFDCPPRQSLTTEKCVSFKPRARGELIDATYHLSLTFARESYDLNLNLGNNREQVDNLIDKAHEIVHDLDSRIHKVKVVGITSPEGTYYYNLNLSHNRSQTLKDYLREALGKDLRNSTFTIQDSISSWFDVADVIDRDRPQYSNYSKRIREAARGLSPRRYNLVQERIGFDSQHRDTVIERALEKLREVQVTYSYKAVMEATEQMVIERYRALRNKDRLPADYYYWILTSKLSTHDEKVAVAQELLRNHASDVRRFKRDTHPADSYGLVLPIAANFLAVDSMSMGVYNEKLLAPYIDVALGQGNYPCYMDNDPNFPVKFINLDVVLYNQIVILCNIGTVEAVTEAYDLFDILNTTPTISQKFRSVYNPESLEMVLDSHTDHFLDNEDMMNRMRRTNLQNRIAVDLADIYNQTQGEYEKIPYTGNCSDLLYQCVDSIPELLSKNPENPAALYFSAVVNLWQSELASGEERDEFYLSATDALVKLFSIEAQPSYISRLQGDSYVRNFYRSHASRRLNRDIYLEAVEKYISDTFNNY